MAYRNRKIRILAAFLIFAQLLFALAGGLTWNASPASAAVAGDVMIAKYHAGIYGIWVVLANAGDQDVDLSGWQMNDYQTAVTANKKWTFPNGSIIRAKSLLIVESKSGSGTAGASEYGVSVISPPTDSTFALSPGVEKIVLWNKLGQQVDEFSMRAPLFAPPYYLPEGLAVDEAYERVSLTDTDTAGDWRKVKSADPIPAWDWTPLTNSPDYSEAPVAEKIAFDPTNPSASKVTGADGAVEADAVVKLYSNDARETVLGSTTATESGAFDITFENTSSLSIVYLTATAQGKSESSVTAVTASVSDTTPPVPIAYAPADGETGVGVNAAVKVTFQEPIVSSSTIQNVTIKDAENVPIAGVQASVSGSELTIAHDEFERGRRYTVTVPAQALQDNAGNAIEEVIVWSFTTAGISDVTPPSVSSTQPAAGASGVAQDAAIKVLFDEPIAAGSELSGISIQDNEGNPVSSVEASVRGSELTIEHAPFRKGMLYTVTVPSNAVKDVYGNAYDSTVTWSFRTGGTQTASAAVALELPNGSAVKQGDTFEVHAMLDDYSNVYGVQLQLKYDPALLQLIGTPEPGAIWDGHPQAAFIREVDAAQGVATFAGMLAGEAEGLSGGEPLPVSGFVFKAVGAPGPADIEFLQDSVKVAAHPDTGSVVVIPAVSGSAQVMIEPGPSTGIAEVALTANEIEPKLGQSFTVSVNLSHYTDVFGAQIQLKYDPARLQLQDEDGGKEGIQVKAGKLFDASEMIQVYNQAVDGTVTFASMLRGDAEGVTGNGPDSVAELTFIPIGTTLGNTTVELVAEHVKLAGVPSEDPAVWQLPYEVTGNPLTVKVMANSGGGGGGGCCTSPVDSGDSSSDLTVTDQGVTIPLASIRKVKEGEVTAASVEAGQLEKAFKRIAELPADAQRLFLTIDNESSVEWQLPANVLSAAAEASPNVVIVLHTGHLSYELLLRLVDFENLADKLNVDLKDLQLTLTMTTLTESELEQLQSGLDDLPLLSAAEFVLTVEGGGSSQVIDDFNGTMVKRSITLPSGTDRNQLTGVRFDDGKPVFVPTLFHSTGGDLTAVILSPTNSMYGVAHHEKSFADVSGHWSQADVELLASKLVVQGVTDTAFAPDADMTRAEFAALLVRSLGLPIEDGGTTAFTDVSQEDWFYGVVEAASNAGLITGYEDGSFKPENTITREQMALMLSRALKVAGKSVKDASDAMAGFADRDEVGAWAEKAVGQMVKSGIIGGMSETALEPKQNATRAQATVMLKRFLTFVGYMNEGGGDSNES